MQELDLPRRKVVEASAGEVGDRWRGEGGSTGHERRKQGGRESVGGGRWVGG
jgi:hypothetical protein